MSVTDELLANNARYAESFTGPLPLPPSKHIAVLACMDARLDVYRALGLAEGEAHVIRNAGGVGTTEIVLVHHTDCGMLTFTDEDLLGAIELDTGVRPPWSCESFTDLEDDVRATRQRILDSPFIPDKSSVRGFVFDVATGRLTEVQ
jgi:carbonic anhydrase